MNLTLTVLDPTRGAFELLPDTDPATGTTVFTARPSRHDRALTQSILAGYGVDPAVTGAGRSEAEDWLYIKARIATFQTMMLVVRHADILTPPMREKLLRLANEHGLALALTCDDSTGADLGAWVLDNGGECHEDSTWLTDRFSAAAPPSIAGDEFPRTLPTGDFYIFRSRCRELLGAHDFEVLDTLYRSVATAVSRRPFRSAQEAADWIRTQYESHPYPAQLRTIVRAAQAAMLREGILLKCDLDSMLTAATDGMHRPLKNTELLRLRGYRQTWRSAVWALRNAGLSITDMTELTVGLDLAALNLTGTAAELVQAHLAFRRLEGGTSTDPFITLDANRYPEAIRSAAVELGLPLAPTNERRDATITSNWRAVSDISLMPLNPKALPGGAAA